MSHISSHTSSSNEPAELRTAVPRNFQMAPPLPRVAVGLTAAVAGVSAAFLVFGPLADLSAIQFSSRPHGPALGSGGKPIVLTRTGSGRGAEADRRAAAASAVQLSRLAPVGGVDASYSLRASK